jgi:hypothetical protein
MQMVKRIFGGFFLSLILLWLFAPKVELYYLLEKSLEEKQVIITNETITDTWYGLKITNADVYVAGAKVANATELNLDFFFLYSSLTVNEVNMDNSLANMAPKQLNHLTAIHSVMNPLKVTINGEGSFGTLDGTVHLLERKIEILFPVVKDIKTIKKFLKKDNEKGWFYETNY